MKRSSLDETDLEHLRELRNLVRRLRSGGRRDRPRRVEDFPRLVRHAASTLARLETRAESPQLTAQVRKLLSEAHGLQYQRPRTAPGTLLGRIWTLLMVDAPRTLRAEWRLLALTVILIYGLAALAFVAVARDLDTAPSLLSPAMVAQEIGQLEATAEGEPFRGNFTFGLGESPQTAGWIMVHNMGVGVIFFASALLPPVYLMVLSQNGLMLGTYTGVAHHWDQAGAISSILWCHGTLEIQALILAGTAGLIMVRAWLRPGPWSRGQALGRESRRAGTLLAPVFPLLFIAGLIEGFVSPHAPLEVRLGTAVLTGLLLLTWALAGGRGRDAAGSGTPQA